MKSNIRGNLGRNISERESTNLEETINIKEMLDVPIRRWKLILISILSITLMVAIFTFFLIKPQYETSAKVFIGKEQGSKEEYSTNDVQMYQQLLKTYSELIKTKDLTKAAIDSSSIDITPVEVLKKLTVVTVADTQIIEIKYRSKSPDEALKMINSIINEFVQLSVKLVPNGNVQVLESATFPEKSVVPNKILNLCVGILLGLMVGIGLSFSLEFLDNTYKTREQVERELGIPVIGQIPKDGIISKGEKK
ncbi:Wzz/FepE/Etk N-terminal domain-containing protein [Clostridium sp.]|uniref:YveK family protein n=1 Tax=Clostridium sp. TaxID=1506 RepID=UPI003217A9E7